MGTLAAFGAQIDFSGRYTKATAVSGSVSQPVQFGKAISLSNGTSSGQGNIYFEDEFTTGAIASPYSLGVGTSDVDIFNVSIGMTRCCYIGVRNTATASGDHITIAGSFITGLMGSATNLVLHAGGVWEVWNSTGWTITSQNITFTRVANNVTTYLLIVGSV